MSEMPDKHREGVAGVILAGGLSRRMGGGDKAMRLLAGRPLLAHAIARLSPHVQALAINANGNPERFADFSLPVIPDAARDFAGPLAGVLAGMTWARAEVPDVRYIVTAACDTPLFPLNLVDALLKATGSDYPVIAMAGSNGHTHPVFGLWPVALRDDLEAALADGVHKVLEWTSRHRQAFAEFPFVDAGGTFVDPFFNVNTPTDLLMAERAFLALENA